MRAAPARDLPLTGKDLTSRNGVTQPSGASLADRKARMGHDSDRATLIHQHATRDADQKIADAHDRESADRR